MAASLELELGVKFMNERPIRSGGQLEAVLRAGHFAITAETSPPDSADPADVLSRAGCLKGLADAVNVLDGAGARAHLSPLATAAILVRDGIEPVLQFTMRDRNRLALQGDLLGGAALGVHNVLCLTGDSIEGSDQPETKPVFDIKSADLVTTARRMRDEGTFPTGRKIVARPKLFLGVADAPRDPAPDFIPTDLIKKIEAGADFIQTQFSFDLDMLRRYMARLTEHDVPSRIPILVGIGPIMSAKSARWMNANLYGVHIPDNLISRLEASSDQKAEGKKICLELLEELRGIDGVAGAHLMAPNGEKAIAEVIAESGIVAGRN